MAIKSGFFKSVNGDRRYQAEFFASYFASFIGNGVFPNPSNNLQVLAFQNMQTRVSVGKAWINGYYLLNDEAITITHAPADGVLRRVDRIVVGLNFDSRQMNIYLKQGTPATNAVAPTLTRNATVYELALADVSILPGNTVVTQSSITDQRLNKDLCGIVHGVVEQIDTTSLYEQYQSSLDEFERLSEAEFRAWFNSLQVILDGNVAANLSARIIQLENSLNNFGGRNYIYRSEDFSGFESHNGMVVTSGLDVSTNYPFLRGTKASEGTLSQIGIRQRSTFFRMKLLDNKPYVLSFFARSNSNSVPRPLIYNTSGGNTNISLQTSNIPNFTNVWTKYVFKFTLNRPTASADVLSGVLIAVDRTSINVGEYFDIAKLKIETGTIATDYVPNYEDSNLTLASQQESQQGVNNANFMTPLRVKQAIDFNKAISLDNTIPLNNLKSNNIYYGFNFIGAPTAGISVLEVEAYNNDWVVQKIHDIESQISYRRFFRLGTTWTTWEKILTQTDYDQLFQFVSNGKALVASAVTGKGVQTAADASFQTIADNINLISTGLKVASGTVTSSSSPLNMVGMDGTSVLRPRVVVSGLTFLPRYILLSDSQFTADSTAQTVYNADLGVGFSGAVVSRHTRPTSNQQIFNINPNSTNTYVTSTGFALPVYNESATVQWVAIG